MLVAGRVNIVIMLRAVSPSYYSEYANGWVGKLVQ